MTVATKALLITLVIYLVYTSYIVKKVMTQLETITTQHRGLQPNGEVKKQAKSVMPKRRNAVEKTATSI